MNRVKQIVGLLENFKKEAILNIVFNLLATLFSVFTFAGVIPFLKILFSQGEVTVPAVAPTFSFSSDALIAFMNYKINFFIATNGAKTALFYFCCFIVTVFFFKNISRYLAQYQTAKIRVGIVTELRKKIHDKILKLPLSYYTEERKGNILTKVTSDVQEIEYTILGSLEMLFRDPIMFVLYFAALLLMNWQLTLFVLVVLPISAFVISLAAKSLKSSAKKGQGKLEEVLSAVEESISGLRIIKGFNAEKTKQKHFDKSNEEFRALMTKLYRRQYLGSPISEFLGAVSLSLIIFYGGYMILDETSSFDGAYFISFIVFFSQLISPAKSFSEAFFRIKKGSASLDRIHDILDADNTIHEVANPKIVKDFTQGINFNNIGFSYDGKKQVLKNINLTIPKGKVYALVGQSGGGKSTLADLVPRFYDVQQGAIEIDGIDVKELGLTSLRDLMGIVSQESILFNDTVFNNIALAKPEASEEEVLAAAKIANAHEFIEKMELGYLTNIGDSGNKLSGGQRQRLSIARAVLKNPPILILDEATSALDTESEQLVQEALENLMKSRTSIVIAHRLSTIQHADQIVVLRNGEIIEQGTHDELLTMNGGYKKLHDLQSFD